MLTWKKGGRNVAFWTYEIVIGHLEDRAEEQKVAQGLVYKINRIWEQREEIEPTMRCTDDQGHWRYKLLLRTN